MLYTYCIIIYYIHTIFFIYLFFFFSDWKFQIRTLLFLLQALWLGCGFFTPLGKTYKEDKSKEQFPRCISNCSFAAIFGYHKFVLSMNGAPDLRLINNFIVHAFLFHPTDYYLFLSWFEKSFK